MSETGTDRRADHEVRQAVDNIQNRFLERVGDRVARGLSMRELAEELIIESLDLTDAHYGCVIRVSTDRSVTLDAVVSVESDGAVSRQHDTLLHRQCDAHLQAVVSSRRAAFSNNVNSPLTKNLPSCHPPIRSYALLPIRENDEVRALLFIANAQIRFDLVLVNRLQSMLDAFIRVHLNSIVNRGINNVIADIGLTSRQLVTLLDASFNGVMTIDEHTRITAFNPACERMFGVEANRVLGTQVSIFLPADLLAQISEQAAAFSASLRGDDARPSTHLSNVQVFKADGQEFATELALFHTRLASQVFTTLVINDISDRIQSARELQNTVVQYKTLTKLAPVGIIKLNQEWTCDYANDMWCQLSGRSLTDNEGSGWVEAIHESDRVQTLMDMRSALTEGKTYRGVVRLNASEGKPVWVSMSATGLINALKLLTGGLIVVMDITEQYLAEKQLKQIAHHDALTGLPNRNSFMDDLHQALSARSPHGIIALLFIDLDGFKAVNDTLGHDAGDELLQQVAKRIRNAIKDTDSVARLGGDEFTVTLRSLEAIADASAIADAIVHTLKQPFLLQMEEVYVSASVGISMATGHSSTSSDANSLIKQADVALYRAKLSGRSRHVFFTPELDQAQRDRSVLITTLRRAVDRQDFELFYQPQLLIKEQRLLGFEALLRWPQDSGEHVSPGAFIDVLEETGLIGELGEWAISQACGQHRIWLRKGLIGPATTMSVNVSARQLGMPHFAQRVEAILQKHSMRPDSLILEITESALVQTVETDIINQLKRLGVQISLDDFGTGYSSFAYLSQLPLDHLKIDRSFIADISRFPHAVTVIKSIIALARTLGIRVIAEGVEDGAVLPLLEAEGCEGYQGYHFSKPLPAREMASRLAELDTVRLSHYANFINLDCTT